MPKNPVGKLVFFRKINEGNNDPAQYGPFAPSAGLQKGLEYVYVEMDTIYQANSGFQAEWDSDQGEENYSEYGGWPNLPFVGYGRGSMRDRAGAMYKITPQGALEAPYADIFIYDIPDDRSLTTMTYKQIWANGKSKFVEDSLSPIMPEKIMNNKNKLVILQPGWDGPKKAPASIALAKNIYEQVDIKEPLSWCVYQDETAEKYQNPANNYLWTTPNWDGWKKTEAHKLRLIKNSADISNGKYVFPFANHNFSTNRSLTTAVDVLNSYEKYGFDSEISIKSVYNYYNKKYEDFYYGGGLGWAKPLAEEKHPGLINNLQNQFGIPYTLAGNNEKMMPSFYLTFLLYDSLRDYQSADIYTQYMSKWFGAQKDKEGISLQNAIDSLINLFKSPQVAHNPGGVAKNLLYDEVKPTKERTSVIAITPDFYKRYQADVERLKKYFPYYNEINIPTLNDNNVFRTILQKRGMFDDIQYLISSVIKIINKILLVDIKVAAGTASDQDLSWMDVDTIKLMRDFWQGLYADYDCYKMLAKTYVKPGSSDANILKPEWVNADVSLQEYNFFNINWSRDINTINKQKKSYYSTQTMTNLPDIQKGSKSGYPPLLQTAHGENMFYDNMSNYASFIGDTMLGVTNLSKMMENKPEASSPYAPWLHPGPLMFYEKEKKTQGILPSLSGIQFLNLLEKLTEALKLDVKKVFNNKENYSEILFFEVQKFTSKPKNTGLNKVPGYSNSTTATKEDYNSLVQTFVLPNDPDRDVVSYIDSQVSYGKTYYYRIYAHTVTVGNILRREKFIDSAKKSEQHWEYLNLPDIKLARVPYYNINGLDVEETKGTLVSDSPPLPPEVTPYSFKDTPDKIGFWFNLNPGEVRRTVSQEILDFNYDGAVGQESSALIWIFEKKLDSEGNMTYRTDDYGGTIEIYRTTKRPTGYWPDFEGKQIASIPVVGSKTFISDVKPNQDYYYTFRIRDVHHLPSFPTVVHHFRVDTSNDVPEANSVRVGVDSSRPVLFHEIIDLSKNIEQKKTTREFKKYLLIEPNIDQTFLHFDKFAGKVKSASEIWNDTTILKVDGGSVFGDPNKESLFGKKFKIRITSKQTGKKMDINLDFKQPEIKEKTGK